MCNIAIPDRWIKLWNISRNQQLYTTERRNTAAWMPSSDSSLATKKNADLRNAGKSFGEVLLFVIIESWRLTKHGFATTSPKRSSGQWRETITPSSLSHQFGRPMKTILSLQVSFRVDCQSRKTSSYYGYKFEKLFLFSLIDSVDTPR